MFSPVDIAIVVGVLLVIFGPKGDPPWGWKFETNERPEERKGDPFAEKRPDSFCKKDRPWKCLPP